MRVKRTFSTIGWPPTSTLASTRPVTLPVSPSRRVFTSKRSMLRTFTPPLNGCRYPAR
jgi:hypothetical protein